MFSDDVAQGFVGMFKFTVFFLNGDTVFFNIVINFYIFIISAFMSSIESNGDVAILKIFIGFDKGFKSIV